MEYHNGFCRFCGAEIGYRFANLGVVPIANAYIGADDLSKAELFHPLEALVCPECKLVQLRHFQSAESIFTDDYAYFSSYSTSWVEHAGRFAHAAAERFSLGSDSTVVEVASNDGYLLQHFKRMNIGVLGIDPCANVADAAMRDHGVSTIPRFFGKHTAQEAKDSGVRPDLMVANNVLAHAPDINDFVSGFKCLLNPKGVATFEFHHLVNLISGNQFDTIYHEHYFYLSLLALETVFRFHGMRVFDVEELPTHGGSLRIFVCHEDAPFEEGPAVRSVREKEDRLGLARPDVYAAFQDGICLLKRDLLRFLIEAKDAGKTIVGYGAPAKGNILLSYCGVGTDFIDFTVDRNPHKQGMLLPGTHIPILHPEMIRDRKPDFLFILPWNLSAEIMEQTAFIRDWGGRFVTPIPKVRVLP